MNKTMQLTLIPLMIKGFMIIMLSSMLVMYSYDFIIYAFTIFPIISPEDAIYIYNELLSPENYNLMAAVVGVPRRGRTRVKSIKATTCMSEVHRDKLYIFFYTWGMPIVFQYIFVAVIEGNPLDCDENEKKAVKLIHKINESGKHQQFRPINDSKLLDKLTEAVDAKLAGHPQFQVPWGYIPQKVGAGKDPRRGLSRMTRFTLSRRRIYIYDYPTNNFRNELLKSRCV